MTEPEKKTKPGPAEERVKIDGDWKDAIRKALKKGPMPPGWTPPDEADDSDTDEKDNAPAD